MHPVPSHCYFCQCIFLGHLFVYVLSTSSGHYEGRFTKPGTEVSPYAGSLSIVDSGIRDLNNIQGSIYSPPSNGKASCEDLEGVGSFDTTCLLNSNLQLNNDLFIFGTGNLEILPCISIVCPIEGCTISFNLSGTVKVGQHAAIFAGSVVFAADTLSLGPNSCINTTSLAGPPPSQTSGTPVGYVGAGGGHGGRGASCLRNTQQIIGAVMFMLGLR